MVRHALTSTLVFCFSFSRVVQYGILVSTQIHSIIEDIMMTKVMRCTCRYDSALSTDPHDGMVPARLALLGLFVHEHAERLVAWWNGKVIDKPAATSLFGPSFPMSAGVPAVSGETTVIAGGEVVAKYSNDPHAQAQAPASSDSVHEHPGMRGEDDSEAEEEELTILGWSVEDILLLVLCGMLALVIYIRAA